MRLRLLEIKDLALELGRLEIRWKNKDGGNSKVNRQIKK